MPSHLASIHRLFLITAALLLCAILLACGADDNAATSSSSESATASSSAAAPAKPAPPADPSADRTGFLYPFHHEGRWGMMDAQGRIAISPQYDVVDLYVGDVARARQSGLWGLLNREGQWVVKPEMTQLTHYKKEGIYNYMKNATPTEQETGYLTPDGKVVWSTRKGTSGEFAEGLAPVWTPDPATGAPDVRYIRADGTEAFKIPGATAAYMFSEGRAAVTKDGKQGFIDTTGAWIVEPKYDWTWPFSDGMALVAVIGQKSRPANEREQQMAAQSEGPRREVWLKGVYGFIDLNGEESVAPEYDSAWPFREEKAWVEKGGKIGFVNTSGHMIVEPAYDKAGFFAKGFAPVMLDGKWGLLANHGLLLVPCEYDEIFDQKSEDVLMGQFVEDYQPLKQNGKWGYINVDGKNLIPYQFAAARHFFGGLAAAQELKDGKPGAWGFINQSGQWAVAPQFDNADDFEQGLARIYKGNAMGYINPKGEFVRPLDAN